MHVEACLIEAPFELFDDVDATKEWVDCKEPQLTVLEGKFPSKGYCQQWAVENPPCRMEGRLTVSF